MALGPAAVVKTVACLPNCYFQSFFFFIAASHSLEQSVAQETQGRRGRIWSEQGGNMAVTSDTLLLSPVHLSAPLGLQQTFPCTLTASYLECSYSLLRCLRPFSAHKGWD